MIPWPAQHPILASDIIVELNDNELVERALTGDPDAFELLYERYFNQVYDLCRRLLVDPDAAADVAQETFLKLLAGSTTSFRPGNFRAWLLVMARNGAIDELRRRRRTRTIGVSDLDWEEEEFHSTPRTGEDPEEVALSREMAQLVWTAARGLNDNDYALLDLNLRKGLEPQELAQELNTSVGNIHTRLSRLRNSLEEAVTALLLVQMGRRQCAQLELLLGDTDETGGISAPIRRRVTRHAEGCSTCQENRGRCVSAALTFGGLVPILPAAALKASLFSDLTAQASAVATGAATVTAAGAAGALIWPSQLWQAVVGTWHSMGTASQAVAATAAVGAGAGVALGAVVIVSSLSSPIRLPSLESFDLVDPTVNVAGLARSRQLVASVHFLDEEGISTGEFSWLLMEDVGGSFPPPDASWSQALPNSLAISDGDGIKTVALWLKDGEGMIHDVGRSTILRDTAMPADPTNFSSSTHRVGVLSGIDSVSIQWVPAVDPEPGSGIAGYSIAWTNDPETALDASMELGPSETSVDSPVFDEGVWYFHFSTIDRMGHQTDPVHLGPFIIETKSGAGAGVVASDSLTGPR